MSEIFDLSTSFEQLGLRSSVLRGVQEMGFTHPTDIQAKLIPLILSGKDMIGQAKTGTGKTAAFGLPILHLADKDISMQALILVPTRELAAQVSAEMEELGRHTPIRTSCIIGGESMHEQLRSMKAGGHILVGTPGRVMDLHGRGDLSFDRLRFVVLDEVDRMLDIGFRDDIRKILKAIPCAHQTIFVSATINEEIERLARSFLKADAEKIVTVSGSLTVSLVDQKFISVEPWDKRALLLCLLKQEKPPTALVFCRTKATVSGVTRYLRDHGVEAREIHGDLAQNKRNRVMSSLRKGDVNVLIASDLAARGLDVEHITHVLNYDLPEDPEVYVHRVGRTARAGRRGNAWAFVTPEEGQLLTAIEKLTGVMIEKMEYPGFKPGPVPDRVVVERQRSQRRSDPAQSLAGRVALVAPQVTADVDDAELRKMFPDGVIPSSAPRRTLGSRFASRRGGRGKPRETPPPGTEETSTSSS
ncbi:MAG: DEAD/DEAH box helicase [Phycisphaeraceae bacterium]|nr:DEAD/DEAH box helicase [Phycisphaeraceae bacterium]